MKRVFEQYTAVRQQADDIARACGRNPGEITLLAVSKTFPEEDIRALYDRGVRQFGESRLQELKPKAEHLPADIEWHFIGSLQTNKVKKVVRFAHTIHSVNSVELLEAIERAAENEKKRIRILLELNVSGENSKTGAGMAAAEALIQAARQCRFADFQGFMTMAPAEATEAECEHYFRSLTDLRNRTEEQTGKKLPVLSMGMSGDFPAAIRAGSTLIRVGTAIFGAR